MILVTCGTGKTGRRILDRLQAKGVPARAGSRRADPAFDWDDPATWPAALAGVDAAYVAYHPDLAFPGAVDAVAAFAAAATAAGVRRLVLLSGRGEEAALAAERAVSESGLDWTVLRGNWFNQNFSESFFLGPRRRHRHPGGQGGGALRRRRGHRRSGGGRADRVRARPAGLRAVGSALAGLRRRRRRAEHRARTRDPLRTGVRRGVRGDAGRRRGCP